MDNKIYCKALLTKVKRVESGAKVFTFRATTEAIDRQNEIVTADGWHTENFLKNPVFLWAHDYRSLPIGKVVRLTQDEEGLLADVIFDQEDDLARQVESKYERGFLSAVSVGFQPLEMDFGKNGEPLKHTQKDLLELSGVPVPANADALVQRANNQQRRAALPPHTTPKAPEETPWDGAAVMRECEGAAQLRRVSAWVDPDGDPEAKQSYKLPHHQPDGTCVWRGVAAAMVALLGGRGGVDIPDADRRGVYNHLARHYGLWDKEPPEFKAADELAAFGPEEVRGLFWEGEMDDELPVQKAGRRLSAKSRAAIQQAVDILRNLLAEEQAADQQDGSGGEPKTVEIETDLSGLLALVGKGE